MKRFALVRVALCSFLIVSAAHAAAPPALVPQPAEFRCGEGQFVLKPDTPILVDKGSADAMNVGRQLAERIGRSTGMELNASATQSADKQPGVIRITAMPNGLSPQA